jgi:hypothetical protein
MDKKALIEHCEAVIKLHEDAAKHRTPEPTHIAELEIHRIALASLTAESDAQIKWDGSEFSVQNVRDGFLYGVTDVYKVPPAASRVPDDVQLDAERWRFMRNFLLVDDIDGGESCETLYSIYINESTFDANMVSLPRRMSVDEAIDVCIRAAAPSPSVEANHG